MTGDSGSPSAAIAGPDDASLPSQPHIGRTQLWAGVVLAGLAIAGCVTAWQVGQLPGWEVTLALSASALVASAFFFLSAAVKRETRRTEHKLLSLRDDVEQHTDEAVAALKRDIERTLQDVVLDRSAQRVNSTADAAETVGARPTTAALHRLLRHAHEYGLAQPGVGVALRDRYRLLIFFSVNPEIGEEIGTLRVQQELPHARTIQVAQAGIGPTRLGDTKLFEDTELGESVAKLQASLAAKQHTWKGFADDVQRGLSDLAAVVKRWIESIESAESPLRMGTIDTVLGPDYVLVEDSAVLTLRSVEAPRASIELGVKMGIANREKAKREAVERGISLEVLDHPLVRCLFEDPPNRQH